MFTKERRNYSETEINEKEEVNVDRPRTNGEIRLPQIKLIDQDGNFVGVIRTTDALQRAYAVGLDLVEIVPTEKPPICKIMDLGKYIFDLRKKKKANTHKAPEDHEIRLTPNTETHDIKIKAKKAIEFLKDGSKVIIQFKAKGREVKNVERMKEIALEFYKEVESVASLETKDNTYILHPKSA